MLKINRVQIYFILTVAILLHLTVLDHINIYGIKPDLILIPVVFFGLFLSKGRGLESGIVAGLFKDIFALDFFGINTVIFALTGFIAGVLGEKVSRESGMTRTIMIIALTAFSMSLHYALFSVFSRWISLGFGEYFLSSVIPASLYTALVSIPVFHWMMKRYNITLSEEYI